MACAIPAPIDAVKTLANEIKNIAGIYMKPRAKGGKPSSFKPIVIKDNEPKKAIGIPHAAAVPIDVFISIPLYLKKGTVKLPPPMPSTEEADPIRSDSNSSEHRDYLISAFFYISVLIKHHLYGN